MWALIILALTVPSAVLAQGPVVFFATRSTSTTAPQSVLMFDEVPVNVGNAFDDFSSHFTAPYSGHYLFSLSAGVTAESPLDIEIVTSATTDLDKGMTTPTIIFRDNLNTDGIDTRSRIAIVELEAFDNIWVTARSTVESDPDSGLTSWAGLYLEGFLDPDKLSIFAASSVDRFDQHFFPVRFNNVTINVGEDFDGLAGSYQAPFNCTLFGAYSVAQEAGEMTVTNFVGDRHSTQMRRQDTSHNGVDMQTRATLMELVIYDYSWVDLELGGVYSDEEKKQSGFVGFAFEPTNPEYDVAWSIFRTAGLNVGEDPIPLTFQTPRVNNGGAWSDVEQNITAPISGFYFVHIDLTAQDYRDYYNSVNVDLLKTDAEGDHIVCGVRRTSLTHNESDGLSRSCVVHLNEGEKLHLRANPWSGLWNDLEGQNAFSGFLIYPDDMIAAH